MLLKNNCTIRLSWEKKPVLIQLLFLFKYCTITHTKLTMYITVSASQLVHHCLEYHPPPTNSLYTQTNHNWWKGSHYIPKYHKSRTYYYHSNTSVQGGQVKFTIIILNYNCTSLMSLYQSYTMLITTIPRSSIH